MIPDIGQSYTPGARRMITNGVRKGENTITPALFGRKTSASPEDSIQCVPGPSQRNRQHIGPRRITSSWPMYHPQKKKEKKKKSPPALGRRESFGPESVETLLSIFPSRRVLDQSKRKSQSNRRQLLGRGARKNVLFFPNRLGTSRCNFRRRRLTLQTSHTLGAAWNASSSSRREQFDIYFWIWTFGFGASYNSHTFFLSTSYKQYQDFRLTPRFGMAANLSDACLHDISSTCPKLFRILLFPVTLDSIIPFCEYYQANSLFTSICGKAPGCKQMTYFG